MIAMDGRTSFSIGESLLSPEDLVAGGAALGYAAITLADTMSVSAMPDFVAACAKHGVKPVIACRLRVVRSLERVKGPACFPKIIVRTEAGWRALLKLLTVASNEDHFYYVPRLAWDDVTAALEPLSAADIALTTGTLYGALRDAESMSVLAALAASFDVFAEITPIASPVWMRQTAVGFRFCADHGAKPVISLPVLYGKGESVSLAVMRSIASNSKRSLASEPGAFVKDYVWKAPRAVAAALRPFGDKLEACLESPCLRDLSEAWANAQNFAESVTWIWSKQPVTLPVMAEDEVATLRGLAITGLRERMVNPTFGDKITRDRIEAYGLRLRRELDVLERLEFSGYFLLAHKIVSWSRDNGVTVGPGRGSIGGSLVAYAIGLTEVDPLRFDLLFERFINPDRLDLPDADIDFMSSRRVEVLRFIESEFGSENVAGVSNYTTLASGSALRDTARIMGLPLADMDVSKFVPSVHGKPMSLSDAREQVAAIDSFAIRRPDVWTHALALEGANRSLGKHAAGVVIAGEPLVNRAVIERRSSEACVNWDKDSVESMGLVKMDILGLSALDLISEAVSHIFARHGVKVDVNRLSLDCPETLDKFRRGESVGVFQFEGGNARKILREIGAEAALTFEDISAITALNRPGPMDSGLLEDYIAIKQGFLAPSYVHELVKPALEETYGVMVYQEQIMRVSVDLCGYTNTEADHLRKIIGKKLVDKMKEQQGKFVSGAVSNGMSEESAQELWEKVEKFAQYSFNKSHSIAYTLISYISMWLKVHYPVEFYAAAVQVADDDKRLVLLREAQARGVSVLPPDVNTSTARFEILNDATVVAPFSAMKGISERGQGAILAARAAGAFESLEDFAARVAPRLVNTTSRARLEAVGAFARIIAGSTPAGDASRKQAQLECCPSIVVGGANISRSLASDSAALKRIEVAMAALASDEDEPERIVQPYIGKRATIMVVTDGPTFSEDDGEIFTAGKTFNYAQEALDEVGLDKESFYWTGLCKIRKPKGQKLYAPSMIERHMATLREEIAATKPQAIILLGSTVVRALLNPKKNPSDLVGSVQFQKESAPGERDDISWLIGFNPAMISFDPSKQAALNLIFKQAEEMLP